MKKSINPQRLLVSSCNKDFFTNGIVSANSATEEVSLGPFPGTPPVILLVVLSHRFDS